MIRDLKIFFSWRSTLREAAARLGDGQSAQVGKPYGRFAQVGRPAHATDLAHAAALVLAVR